MAAALKPNTSLTSPHDTCLQKSDFQKWRDIYVKEVQQELVKLTRKIDDRSGQIEVKLIRKIDDSNKELTRKIDDRSGQVEVKLTRKIDDSNKELTGKIDDSNKELTGKIDHVEVKLTRKIDESNKELKDIRIMLDHATIERYNFNAMLYNSKLSRLYQRVRPLQIPDLSQASDGIIVPKVPDAFPTSVKEFLNLPRHPMKLIRLCEFYALRWKHWCNLNMLDDSADEELELPDGPKSLEEAVQIAPQVAWRDLAHHLLVDPDKLDKHIREVETFTTARKPIIGRRKRSEPPDVGDPLETDIPHQDKVEDKVENKAEKEAESTRSIPTEYRDLPAVKYRFWEDPESKSSTSPSQQTRLGWETIPGRPTWLGQSEKVPRQLSSRAKKRQSTAAAKQSTQPVKGTQAARKDQKDEHSRDQEVTAVGKAQTEGSEGSTVPLSR